VPVSVIISGPTLLPAAFVEKNSWSHVALSANEILVPFCRKNFFLRMSGSGLKNLVIFECATNRIWNLVADRRVPPTQRRTGMGRYLLLWLLGIPIPILVLIWLFGGLH
jgi:hypothetical protein